MENRELVRQRAGQVQLSTELFTPDQQVTFEKISVIADRNPILKWARNDPNHNLDFCLIEGRIEAVKNFHMKTLFTAGLSYANKGYQIIGENKDARAVATVRVWREGDPRIIEEIGGASAAECWGTNGRRAFHDMISRAQTRALKKAVEAYMGFAFINLIIKEIFGGYEVEGMTPEDAGISAKDVTEPLENPTSRASGPQESEKAAIVQEIYKILGKAVKSGVISTAEANERWERVGRFNTVDDLLKEQDLILKWVAVA